MFLPAPIVFTVMSRDRRTVDATPPWRAIVIETWPLQEWEAMSSNSITQVETFGFERMPDRSRYARPIDLFRLLFGGCNTFSTSMLGSFPVLTVCVYGFRFMLWVNSIKALGFPM
jgi:hypothetical protein